MWTSLASGSEERSETARERGLKATLSGCGYRQARNEQRMVHAAAEFARARNRLSTLACTSSIESGAPNSSPRHWWPRCGC